MNCHQCQADLEGFLRHELSAAERQAIEAHLSSCAVCHTTAASLDEYLQKMSGLREKVVVSPGFLERVSRRLPGPSPLGWRFAPTTIKLTATAAAILLVTLLWYGGTGPDELARQQKLAGKVPLTTLPSDPSSMNAKEHERERKSPAEENVRAPLQTKQRAKLAKRERALPSDDGGGGVVSPEVSGDGSFADDQAAAAPFSEELSDNDAKAQSFSRAAAAPSSAREALAPRAARPSAAPEGIALFLPKKGEGAGLYKEVSSLAGSLRGRIASTLKDRQGRPERLSLVVPTANFPELIVGLEKLGSFKSEVTRTKQAGAMTIFEFKLVYPE